MVEVAFGAQLVRHRRRQRGWSQQDLADASGISLSTVKRAERGHTINPTTYRLLAKTLGVPRSEFDALLRPDSKRKGKAR